ncbi:MAG: hypothetical protein ACE5KF_02070 [Kiloniellaceae bacterium]
MPSLSGIVKGGLVAALVAAALTLGAPTAIGHPVVCSPRYQLLERLKLRYGEQRTAFGITLDGRLVEVLASPSGSWTILVTYPGGQTCVMAAGDGWQPIARPPDGPVA